MQDRIDELELHYMHQEKTIQELNEIVCRQELAIELLKREVALLKEQSLLMNSSVTRDPDQEEPPPHY
ncbi:MAG: SlyX family protein [Steroidobacteraceae bacterium]|nr:SlyX family protein [Deltaproteobacteria bacterium]